jgi:hypothetical protein
MLDENICRKCRNQNAPASQSSCWGCRDNDLFDPIDKINPNTELIKFKETSTKIQNDILKVLKIIEKEETEKTTSKISELQKKLEETTEMLNYAVSDLKLRKCCETCRFLKKGDPDFCFADGCSDGDCWEWRGKSGRE